MRIRSRVALALSVALVPGYVAAGCVSNNNGTPTSDGGGSCEPGTTGDSCGADASPPSDAGCITLNGAVVCSPEGDTTVPTEAGPGPGNDAGDANASDAGDTGTLAANVTMTVTSPSGPEPGITVVFGDSTGAVLGSRITDDAGVATGAISANGAVTVLFGAAGSATNVSILGAQPGDALTMQDPTKTPTSPGSPWMDITSAPPTPPASATLTYVWFGNCGVGASGTLPGDLQITSNCFNHATDQTPALLLAEGDNGVGVTTEFAYSFQKANPITTFSGAQLNDVAMGADTWVTSTGETLVLTNPPTGVSSATAYYQELANGVVHSNWLANASIASSVFVNLAVDGGLDGGFPAAFASHPGYPDFVQSEVDLFRPALSAAKQIVAVRAAAPTATNAFDLSQMIPVLNAPTVTTPAPGQPAVSWSATATLPASAVGAVLTFTWSGTSGSGTWTLVSPTTASTAQAPALPAGSAAWAPVSADGGAVPVSASPTAVVGGGTAVPTYGQFRATYPTPANLAAGGALLAPLANDGTLFVSAYE